jgi:hypothetical protein
MVKALRVAGEVDSWCTRCRLLLNHRIVSMKAGKPHQVECLTCRAQHLWRSAAPGTASRQQASSAARSPSPARPARSASRHVQDWEQAVLGHSVLDFREYSVAGTFQKGDLMRHKKFGEGVVTRVIDARKVEVLFRDEARILAQGSD